MSLIRCQSLSFSFGHALLLDKANLVIQKGQHIALLGRNGEGKSTLLKLLNEELFPESGEIQRARSVTVRRLSQSVPLKSDDKIIDVVAKGLGEIGLDLIAYQNLLQNEVLSDEQCHRMSDLQDKLDKENAWALLSKIETVLTKMDLPSGEKVRALSGGMRRRVLLAQALLSEPDLLLLDEPTNHLDVASIRWLELFLQNYKGAFIVVTHDRHFLQATSQAVLEIDRGKLSWFEGDYAFYQKNKAMQLDAEEKAAKLFDKKLALEETWIRQGIKARRTRNEGRVRALESLRKERQARRERQSTLSLQGNQLNSGGKIVFEAEQVSYAYEEKPIVNGFSSIVLRGDKIGILGPNGCGKTTLLKLLLGELPPQKGQLKIGTKLEIAYFDQLRDSLEEEKSLVDNVGKGSDFVEVFGESKHVIAYLQAFLFTPERARSPVKYLSGGERNRLLLATLFTKKANVLIFDEPTNDLDIESLEILESFLVKFKGTVLIVSHDRTFLDNVVNMLWVYEGEGHFNEYVGGYDDYLRVTQDSAKKEIKVKKVKEAPKKKIAEQLTLTEKKELKALPKKIENLENKIAALQAEFADPTVYERLNTGVLDEKKMSLKSLEKDLEKAYLDWEKLENKLN
jgi:ATP-binding cassette subfamily F protein uup